MSVDDDDNWRTYASDAEDALRDIERSLLALESEPANAEEVNRLYRGLHTLKGNSAMLGLDSIETLAHSAEDMVGLARDGGVAVDQEMVDLMLQLVDRLKMVVERAGREHRDAEPAEVETCVERVRAWTRQHGGEHAENGPLRGEILLWSEPPSAGAPEGPASNAGPAEEADEFFLALCREVLPRLLAGLDAARRGKSEQTALAPLLSELMQPAVRLGYFDLVDCLGTLELLLQQGSPASELEAPRAQLGRLLGAMEQRQRELTPDQNFGIAALFQRPEPAPSSEPGASPERGVKSAATRRAGSQASRDAPRPDAAATPETPAPRAADTPKAAEAVTGSEFLRIDARKLSLVMELAGEIALACGAVTHHPELDGLELEGLAAASHKLEMLIRELQSEVSAMRLVPVAGVFQRMKRVVRDASRRTGKEVQLRLVGEDTEIDKVMVDSLHDPLVHIVRNAVDHGIEPPHERVALGKSRVGTIVLEAAHQGGEVSVKVRDDGRGLDRERILARARERGLIQGDARLSDAQIADLVFLPGFSTKEKIDELSGRGVGMDVIKTTVESLRGRVQLETRPGRGSSLNLTLPLTLAFVEAMVVRERDRLFALPIEKVFEVFKVDRGQLWHNSADGQTTLRIRDNLIPLLWLHRFYGERDRQDETLEGKVVVVVQNSRGSVALPIDALLGNQPVMLKPLRGVLAGVRAAAGCGMLRSGEVALALDCEHLHA